MIDMTRPMPTLMLGGPADAKRIALEPGTREYYCPVLPDLLLGQRSSSKAETVTYSVGTLRGTFNEIFYVGVRNLNDDPIEMLLRGYRRPGDPNRYINLDVTKSVTLLGGPGDGKRHASSSLDEIEYDDGRVLEFYKVVPLVGKDQQLYYVGLLDPLKECPIRALVEGYRVAGVPA